MGRPTQSYAILRFRRYHRIRRHPRLNRSRHGANQPLRRGTTCSNSPSTSRPHALSSPSTTPWSIITPPLSSRSTGFSRTPAPRRPASDISSSPAQMGWWKSVSAPLSTARPTASSPGLSHCHFPSGRPSHLGPLCAIPFTSRCRCIFSTPRGPLLHSIWLSCSVLPTRCRSAWAFRPLLQSTQPTSTVKRCTAVWLSPRKPLCVALPSSCPDPL